MADIVISIVGKLAEYLVEPVTHEVLFFLCVQNKINDLKGKLINERDRLQRRVEEDKNSGKIIEETVETWLNDVENILKEVAELDMEANNNCFQDWCPTLEKYRLCKKMIKQIETVEKDEGKFSRPAPLPGIRYEASENFVYFESTRVAHDQLMEALQDDRCCMIGVYGMGGSGKTTLVTEVGKKVEELNLFDKAILITVSQTPNIRTIQGKLADILGFKLDQETEEGRAQGIWVRLKEKKRILIIVDDLWERFELRKIGICLENDYRGRWKILVTTRRQQVCNSMECQKRIHLGLLSDDESWTLFTMHAKIDDESSKTMKDVPRKVCKECKGLPIAITALGSSLNAKSNVEWEIALDILMHSEAFDHDMEEGVRDVYKCLKLSYDYLKNEEAQFVFLICCMFPEDYDIPVEGLIRYAIGLGLTRRRIQVGIKKLLDSCLLLHAHVREEEEDDDDDDCVKMHDLVRDVALWIAEKSKDHEIFVNVDKPLSSVVMDNSIRDPFAISSWYEENKISVQLDAPNLEILLLHIKVRSSLDLSDVTFKGGDNKLKVFTVINEPYGFHQLSLPCSIKEWTNLQIVRLNGWDLPDISFITTLTRLVVLDLRLCILNKLPIEIEKLKILKMLDLSDCVFKEEYNGAIGKCLQVQELYASERHSKYLSQGIRDILTHPKLQRFAINHGSCIDKSVVKLEKFDISKLRESGRNLLQIADVVYLSCCCEGCKNVIPDLIRIIKGMGNLIHLYLKEEKEIECILDATSDSYHLGSLEVDALIPRLVELHLDELKSLKELCRGPPQFFFDKLEKLRIDDCPQLHTIFPVECNLQNLKILTIVYWKTGNNCMLDEVLFSISVAQSLRQLEELTIEGIDGLKHIIGSTSMRFNLSPQNSRSLMPSLNKIHIACCIKLESLLPICCVEGLVQLQEVKIVNLPKLKYVFGECDHMDHSSLQYENQIMLPRLKDLRGKYLSNLIDMCPENYSAKWSFPSAIIIEDCPKFAMTAGLQLHAIFSVECNLQNLKFLTLKDCMLGEVLFSVSVAQSLQQLRELTIEGIHGLKHIIGSRRGHGSSTSRGFIQPQDSRSLMPNLNEIHVAHCNKLESLLPICFVEGLVQLQRISMRSLPELKYVFGECDHTDHSSLHYESQILLSRLENLKLCNLQNLNDMCPGNYPVNWPCALNVDMIVIGCPKL